MTDEQPPVTPPEPTPEPIPFYRRGWFIALAAVVIIIVLTGIFGGDTETAGSTTTVVDSSTTSAASAATSAPEASDSTAPATTTATTTATTAPPATVVAPWEPITVESSGDDVIEFAVPNNDPALLEITHDGSANFVVNTHTADNQDIDLLVNVIGEYQGTRPINFVVGEEVGLIEVQADGAWMITARPLSEEGVTASPASGAGDAVVVIEITSPSLDITHDGEANFVVLAWTTEDRELLVNEIGPYAGTVLSPTGTVVFEIQADGAWTLTSS